MKIPRGLWPAILVWASGSAGIHLLLHTAHFDRVLGGLLLLIAAIIAADIVRLAVTYRRSPWGFPRPTWWFW